MILLLQINHYFERVEKMIEDVGHRIISRNRKYNKWRFENIGIVLIIYKILKQ